MNRKIELAKRKKEILATQQELTANEIKARQKLVDATKKLFDLINDQEQYDFTKLEKQLEKIDKSLDLSKYFTNLERSIKDNSPHAQVTKTKIQDFSKLLEAVSKNKPIPLSIDLTKLEKAVVNIEQYIQNNSKPSDQGAENYQPVRRVLKVGNRFIFDDNFTNAGGGSGGGGTTDGLTDAQLRASPVPVTASIDTTGLATSTKQDTGNTSLSSIDGKITAVNTGAVVVSSSALPSGAATSAKQPALGTAGTASADVITVQGKAAMTPLLTDGSGVTQPVSGTVTANTGLSQPLTDTQLRATAVPVSGTFYQATQPVSGTVTANAGTNLNTSALATEAGNLATIKTNTDKIPSQGQALAAASTPVVLPAAQITTLTPPAAITGFATSANQATIIGHVDGIEAAVDGIETLVGTTNTTLTTIDGRVDGLETLVTSTNTKLDTANTSLGTLDNAISGNEMQVDVVASLPAGTNNIGDVDVLSLPALPAGTNAIGKLSANSGVDIGDVDVTSSVSATLDHGSNLDIDTTAEQITTTSFAAKFGVTVKSAADNTDTVYIGNSDVTAGTTAATDGFPLEPGESITLPVNNSNLLYAIGAAANQKVFWSAV